MKRLFILIVLISSVLSGCKKDEAPSLTGTVTIDNKIYQSTTYYAYGFSFSKAKKVSTLDTPGPDVTLFVIDRQSGEQTDISGKQFKSLLL